jgi:PPK2 family polyphosphate:nucleotide phosphotransferase
MFEAPRNEWLVPFAGGFGIDQAPTSPGAGHAPTGRRSLKAEVRRIAEAQRILYADDRYALLLIFQAMDAAGKDSTIRAVLSGVNPAGCHVVSFKQPSTLELDQDFLWRTSRELPPRGRIGVFNRSSYEEVLIVSVHRQLLEAQRLPPQPAGTDIFAGRYESIRSHEAHLARNGVVVLKFFLNVSPAEQRRRLLARLKSPRKHWKFSARDVAEAKLWPDYMAAYEAALNETSRPWAPWYAIPADDKPFMRWQVARIVADSLQGLKLSYPPAGPERRAELKRMRLELREPRNSGRGS